MPGLTGRSDMSSPCPSLFNQHRDRAIGAFLGLAVGDTIGTSGCPIMHQSPLLKCVHYRGKQLPRVSTKRFSRLDELKHVEATLTAFVLRDERLRHAELLGNLLLSQARAEARLPQQGDQSRVSVCSECLAPAPEPERCGT